MSPGAGTVDHLEEAVKAAVQAHAGQVREGREDVPDEPYLLHAFRVMLAVPREARVVGVLHDVLEDAGPGGLKGLKLSEDEQLALEALTRRAEETYGEYISRLLASGSRLVLLVKRADLRDNLGAACPPSLRGRYLAALALVEDALRESDLRDARDTLDIEAAGPEDKERGDQGPGVSATGHPVVRLASEDADELPQDVVEVEINPDALYDSLQTAILLGFGGSDKNRRSQVSAIPDDELTRIPTGPRGGKIRFMGEDIIGFIHRRRERQMRGRASS